MKIAFATEGSEGLDAVISQRFGRARFFTIVEVNEVGNVINVKVIENPGFYAERGAGVRAVQRLIEEGVNVVVAGDFGPNALAVLRSSGIRPVRVSGVAVREALTKALQA
ncbi:MAG TPA: dinitrogenase iron-molybdenum cofactor biosynthesis protein [Acidilobales archaeon]|nr:MAG: dinitrogenase iron-molybdenum cofactor biosynthesis protein [Thermoprotei archaeon]HDD26863.1 dinitrogenase iron-molybdenum cofactor biosynthesis protein [Acidilobales archaeon]